MIARSEQLRDRLATFGQKGCTYVRQSFELFNEQVVINCERDQKIYRVAKLSSLC